jgi:hypothetical protein
MTMSPLGASLVIGFLSGVHAASWGMYKDAPHEGFERRKFLRSIASGVVIAPAAAHLMALDPTTASGAVLLFGVAYVLERLVAEIYKTFLRQSDQSKYAIPMQLAVLGRPVESRTARVVLGAGYSAGLLGLAILVQRYLEQAGPVSPVMVALVGSIGGWVSAFGGAWKDAPFEGFQPLKFLRSPLLAAGWALLLAQLSSDLVVVTLAAIGFTIATTESYKTFLFPSRPRGKFAGKPVRFPEILRTRNRVVPVYVGIWLLVLLMLVGGVRHG